MSSLIPKSDLEMLQELLYELLPSTPRSTLNQHASSMFAKGVRDETLTSLLTADEMGINDDAFFQQLSQALRRREHHHEAPVAPPAKVARVSREHSPSSAAAAAAAAARAREPPQVVVLSDDEDGETPYPASPPPMTASSEAAVASPEPPSPPPPVASSSSSSSSAVPLSPVVSSFAAAAAVVPSFDDEEEDKDDGAQTEPQKVVRSFMSRLDEANGAAAAAAADDDDAGAGGAGRRSSYEALKTHAAAVCGRPLRVLCTGNRAQICTFAEGYISDGTGLGGAHRVTLASGVPLCFNLLPPSSSSSSSVTVEKYDCANPSRTEGVHTASSLDGALEWLKENMDKTQLPVACMYRVTTSAPHVQVWTELTLVPSITKKRMQNVAGDVDVICFMSMEEQSAAAVLEDVGVTRLRLRSSDRTTPDRMPVLLCAVTPERDNEARTILKRAAARIMTCDNINWRAQQLFFDAVHHFPLSNGRPMHTPRRYHNLACHLSKWTFVKALRAFTNAAARVVYDMRIAHHRSLVPSGSVLVMSPEMVELSNAWFARVMTRTLTVLRSWRMHCTSAATRARVFAPSTTEAMRATTMMVLTHVYHAMTTLYGDLYGGRYDLDVLGGRYNRRTTQLAAMTAARMHSSLLDTSVLDSPIGEWRLKLNYDAHAAIEVFFGAAEESVVKFCTAFGNSMRAALATVATWDFRPLEAALGKSFLALEAGLAETTNSLTVKFMPLYNAHTIAVHIRSNPAFDAYGIVPAQQKSRGSPSAEARAAAPTPRPDCEMLVALELFDACLEESGRMRLSPGVLDAIIACATMDTFAADELAFVPIVMAGTAQQLVRALETPYTGRLVLCFVMDAVPRNALSAPLPEGVVWIGAPHASHAGCLHAASVLFADHMVKNWTSVPVEVKAGVMNFPGGCASAPCSIQQVECVLHGMLLQNEEAAVAYGGILSGIDTMPTVVGDENSIAAIRRTTSLGGHLPMLAGLFMPFETTASDFVPPALGITAYRLPFFTEVVASSRSTNPGASLGGDATLLRGQGCLLLRSGLVASML